jgi:hypothetical protein
MKRIRVLWGGIGVVAAAVIIYFAFLNPSPSDEDVAGAIGVAKQYRADQITEADVVLQEPEVQELLQSDFFHKLVTDADFRKVAVDQLARINTLASQLGEGKSVRVPVELTNLRHFLDLTASNSKLGQALAEGKMNVVNAELLKDGKQNLASTANWIHFAQGSDVGANLVNLGNMKILLDVVSNNPELKTACAEGKATRAQVEEGVLSAKGRAENMDYAVDMFLNLTGIDGKVAELPGFADQKVLMEGKEFKWDIPGNVELKTIAAFAGENDKFARAIREGKLNVAADIAIAAGKKNISLFGLKTSTYLVGNSKNFASDLKRIAAVSALPSYKSSARHPGWGKLVAMSTESSWKQTVEAVKDGRFNVSRK